VIGSNNGRAADPQWYRNLQADSKVWVRHLSNFYEATATTMEPEARRAYWEELTTRMPVFAEFQEKAGRDLPLVRISRVT
jgi:deazaflavin-dependent oxidoreductase (nitroreductase family)